MPVKSTGKPGRRAGGRGKPSTRTVLLRVARRLFARDGYPAVSVRQLAQEAGVNPAMVHYHFGKKEGLYLAVIEETVSPVLQQLSTLLADGPLDEEALADLLRSYLELLRKEPWLPPLVAREVLLRDGPLQTAFIGQIASQVAAGLMEAVADSPAAQRSGANLTALSILSMALFPFVGQSVVRQVFGFALDEDYTAQMATHIAGLIFAQSGEEKSV